MFMKFGMRLTDTNALTTGGVLRSAIDGSALTSAINGRVLIVARRV